MITLDRLKELLTYEPETGRFYRRASRFKSHVGKLARGKIAHGRCYVSVDGHDYSTPRLAWMYVHGYWPTKEIDHKNRDKTDNRISNLREATRSENQANTGPNRLNKLGIKGVRLVASGKFQSTFCGKYLGTFTTAAEAEAAYCRMAKMIYGEFAIQPTARTLARPSIEQL